MTREEVRRKYGDAGVREYDALKREGKTDAFILSALVGFATESIVLGAVVGGSLLGGVLGGILGDDDDGGF